ncbi:Glycosyl transferase family 11 [Stieleria neptunia]|uniref:Glycosyl transferase family 11 n=1 Tax=Stieleria neptunia TaxID=2527979 RepID=A0A518HUQ0_9BACT|nr:alpha-1,2-fucosyltransferase [Stieleria neptunia]QDV44585.1 Glycosyl transferase family 11 [Stieleria neptunia]
MLYANLIAAARHYGVELRNPCFAEYANLFPSTRHDLWCRYDRHLNRSTSDIEPGQVPSPRRRGILMNGIHALTNAMNTVGLRHYPAKVIRLRSGQVCDLEGDQFRSAVDSGRTMLLQGWCFRGPRLLQQHWSQIRDFFAISPSDQEAIGRTLDQARRESDLVVGVHIRRGDYAQFRGGRYCFDDHLYAQWMHSVCEQLPGRKVQFLVCSHEQLNLKNFSGLHITRGPGSALRDMYALAETDWMMGPPSTFTTWAAYFGQKPRVELHSREHTVVAPNDQAEQAVA